MIARERKHFKKALDLLQRGRRAFERKAVKKSCYIVAEKFYNFLISTYHGNCDLVRDVVIVCVMSAYNELTILGLLTLFVSSSPYMRAINFMSWLRNTSCKMSGTQVREICVNISDIVNW